MTGWTVLVAAHAFAACVALPLGGWQLFRRPYGDARHRVVGRVWVGLMLFVATSSFAIRDLRHGELSLLHILSAVTIVTVTLGLVSARRGRIAAHRANMRGSWFGLLGAFVGAVAVPARLLPTFAVTEPLGAAAAAVAVAATAGAVLVLARLADPGPARLAADAADAGTRAQP